MFNPAILRRASKVLAPNSRHVKWAPALTETRRLEVAQQALGHELVPAKVKREVSVLEEDALRLRELLSSLVKEDLCKLVEEGQFQLRNVN